MLFADLLGSVAVLCLSQSVEPRWFAAYAGPGELGDRPHAIAMDPEGNVVVTGFSNSGVVPEGEPPDHCSDDDGCEDVTTIKYSPDGEELWVALYNGASSEKDTGFTLDVDAAGSIYVGAETHEIDATGDPSLLKYSAEGQLLWRTALDDEGGFGRTTAVHVDPDGTAYLAGSTFLLSGPELEV